MDDLRASRTAVLTCQGRAVAQGRFAPGRFDDPTAMVLLRAPEREAVEAARSGTPPAGWSERVQYEMLRASGEVMAPRTVAIDDAVRANPTPQLVVLGAGLDGRAWRMPQLAGVDVLEVDHPASQRDKRDRLGDLPPTAGSVVFVAVDLTRDDLGAALAAGSAGRHRSAGATTWIWEGVGPYLTPQEVRATLSVLGSRSAPGSRLVVNYQSPSVAATAGRLVARAMSAVARREDPVADEARRSSWRPTAMAALLAEHGFRALSDDDLLTIAADLGVAVRNRRSAGVGRVVVADRWAE